MVGVASSQLPIFREPAWLGLEVLMPHKFDDPLWPLAALTPTGGVLASGMKEDDDDWLELSAWVRQREGFGHEAVAFHHGQAKKLTVADLPNLKLTNGDLVFVDGTTGELDNDCWMMELKKIGGPDLKEGTAIATAHALVLSGEKIGKNIGPPREKVQRVLQWTQVLQLEEMPDGVWVSDHL
jgi:hypothetical protein